VKKDFFKGKSFVTNEELQDLINTQNLDEIEKRNALLEVRDINQRYFLKELKRNQELKRVHNDITFKEVIINDVKEENLEESDNKIIDVSFYLNQIKECENVKEIISVLPKNNNYDFERLINTILMHYIEDCVEIENFIASEELTQEEQEEFLTELHTKKEIMNKIIEYRNQPIIVETEIKKNNLIYLNSSSGNVYAQNDLKSIDIDYYDSFLELLNSIIDGSFKNVKNFSNNNKIGQLYEVKDFKTRIVFDRIDKNTIIIISIFMKKTDKDLKYREQIVNRATKYRNIRDMLKMLCKNPEYIKENEEITNELLDTLSRKGETRK